MALIQCAECNAEVSDSAPACPRCGVAAPGGVAILRFVRPSFLGGGNPAEVYVDGQPFGRLKRGREITVSVTPGARHIEVITGQGRSTVGTVDARPGETTLTVKLSIVNGAASWE